MEIKYTKAQEESIYDRGNNLLVSAAAGSGKTLVLVKRIISIMLEQKIDIDRMLIVTFTNAAANQMKEKIREEIEVLLQSDTKNVIFLRKQLRKLSNANISTMHSFCIGLLRNNFQYLGIDPNFSIVNPASEIVLKDRALAFALDIEYSEKREDFKNLVEGYGGRRGERIPEIINDIYNKIQSEIYPTEWLKDCIEEFEPEAIMKTVKESISESLYNAYNLVQEAYDIAKDPMGPHGYINALEDDLSQLDRLLEILNTSEYDELINVLPNIKYTRLSGRKSEDEELKETAKFLRDEHKKILNNIKKEFETKTRERIISETKLSNIYLKAIVRIILNYENEFNRLKTEKATLTFSDIEHLTVRLLNEAEISKEIKSGIDYIFFDEYQDINPLQEFIIEKLSGNNNLFFVGDIKQSIYRFRLSDPGLFNTRYDDYSQNNKKGKVINLSQNFRSSPAVLEYLNFLFSSLLTKKLGEVDYLSEGQALVPGKDVVDDGSVHLVLNNEILGTEEIHENSSYIANEIKRLVNECGYEYKDIVILLRTIRNRIEPYEEALRESNIPYFSDVFNVSLSDPEVSIFINYLKIINNYKDDMALLSSLLSPFGGLNEDDISRVKMIDKDALFYECLNEYRNVFTDDLSVKIDLFFQKLIEYREELNKKKLSEFAYYIAYESGYISYLEALFLGEQKVQNLMAFIMRIEEFEEFSHSDLSGFLNHVDRLLKSPSESLEPTQLISGADNVVRIMSIHKSKGLEFPIVFVGDLERQFTLQESRDPFMVDKELGIGCKVADLDKGSIYSTTHRKILEAKKKDEMNSEEMRLLYVATTRAKDRLYLVGKVRDVERHIQKTVQTPKMSVIENSKSMLDWISAVALKDKVHYNVVSNYTDYDFQSNYFVNSDNTDKYHLQINLEGFESIPKEEIKPEVLSDASQGEFDLAFEFKYPHIDDTKLPFKKTVSEITAKNVNKTDDTYDFQQYFEIRSVDIINKLPKILMSQDRISSAEEGSLIHFVFQNISIKKHNIESVVDEIERMVYLELLTEQESKVIDPMIFVNFFNSKLGERLIKNINTLKRETSFTMRYENIFLDGQVDCYFEEDGKIILLDFKSDKTISVTRYKHQLDLYQRAIELAMEYKVTERYIYWTRFNNFTKL